MKKHKDGKIINACIFENISTKSSPILYDSTSSSIHMLMYNQMSTILRKELPKVGEHQKDYPEEHLSEAEEAIPDHSIQNHEALHLPQEQSYHHPDSENVHTQT